MSGEERIDTIHPSDPDFMRIVEDIKRRYDRTLRKLAETETDHDHVDQASEASRPEDSDQTSSHEDGK